MIIVNQSVLRRCNASISLGTSTETLRFTRRVRVSEIIKPWRVSDILHSFPKGFSDSYCEICHQIILCFLRWGSKFGHFKWPSDAYLRLAGAHGLLSDIGGGESKVHPQNTKEANQKLIRKAQRGFKSRSRISLMNLGRSLFLEARRECTAQAQSYNWLHTYKTHTYFK